VRARRAGERCALHIPYGAIGDMAFSFFLTWVFQRGIYYQEQLRAYVYVVELFEEMYEKTIKGLQ
tara:strand:- start:56 stop:250 length:195 start_codon:yes stop_codon:yes gene_type:complete